MRYADRELRSTQIVIRTKPSVQEMANTAAAKQNRSLSNYIEHLIELDNGFVPEHAPRRNGAWEFPGKVIKIDRQTYDDWKVQFDNLPDLDAALMAADEVFAHDPPADWMEQLVAWLVKENGNGSG